MVHLQDCGAFQELKELIYVGKMGQPHAQLAAEVRAAFHRIVIKYGASPEDMKVLEYFRVIWLTRPGARATRYRAASFLHISPLHPPPFALFYNMYLY